MAIVKMTYIICDVCGQTFGVDNSAHYTGTMQRKNANAHGWTYGHGNKDYCPDCRPLKKNGEKYALRIHKQLNKQSKEE